MFGCLDFKTFFSTKTETKRRNRSGIFCTCKNSRVTKISCFAVQTAACDGNVSPTMRVRGSPRGTYTVPAWDLSWSQHSPFGRVYQADPEKRTKSPKSSLLRPTEVHVQLFSVRNWSEDSRKCFSDRVHSEMSYILILPQHDSSSWTDLTFLLKPAIRSGHFLPSWHYFQEERPGAPAPVAGAAIGGNLYKPSFVPTAQPGVPELRQGPGSVSREAGWDSEARQPQEGTFRLPLPGCHIPRGHSQEFQPCSFDTRMADPMEGEEVLGVTANLVRHVGMQM